jgi:uncharacterized protein (DUF1330 family)
VAAYVVVNVEVLDPALYEEYKRQAPSSIAAHGGRYLARGGEVQVMEGRGRPPRLVILEFPSAAKAKAWWESSEYSSARRLRQSCARADLVIVDGVPPE